MIILLVVFLGALLGKNLLFLFLHIYQLIQQTWFCSLLSWLMVPISRGLLRSPHLKNKK